MAYWIQGLFFQPVLEIKLDMDMRVVSRSPLILEHEGQFMFHGSIWLDPESNNGRLTGVIEDGFGIAALSHIRISDKHFAFTKQYEGRSDQIRYVFGKKDGPTWVGTWSGPWVGDGIARCLVTELPDDFLGPASIKIALELAKLGG